FKLYDTFGFPLDLTQLMAEERGYDVDVAGFEKALGGQRARSRADRAASVAEMGDADDPRKWSELSDEAQRFVGYDRLRTETPVLAYRIEGERIGLMLRDNPFYVESGGQVSDRGTVAGDGWSLEVDRVARVGERTAVFGPWTGSFPDDA